MEAKALEELNGKARLAAMAADDLVARVNSATSDHEPSTDEIKEWAVDNELACAELDSVGEELNDSLSYGAPADVLEDSLARLEAALERMGDLREWLSELGRPRLSDEAPEPAVAASEPGVSL